MESGKASERLTLCELFRQAWNGAIGAVFDQIEDERTCLDALTRLKTLPVSIDVIDSTTVARSIKSLYTHPKVNIQKLSREVIEAWNKKRQRKKSSSVKSRITAVAMKAKPKKSGLVKFKTGVLSF